MTVFVEPQSFDFQTAGSLSDRQGKNLVRLSSTFAAEASFRLSAQLRKEIVIELQGAEQRAQTQGGEEDNTVRLFPLEIGNGGTGALLLGKAVAVQLLELRLGKNDVSEPDPERRITELEMRVLQTVVRGLLADLERACKPVADIKIRLAEEVDEAHPESASLLAITWTIHMEGLSNHLELLIPLTDAGPLLFEKPASDPTGAPLPVRQGRYPLIPVVVCARTSSATISLGDLRQLRPGDTLRLDTPANAPAQMDVNGLPVFTGSLVTSSGQRAIRVDQPVAPSKSC